jgi:hypothetical protein
MLLQTKPVILAMIFLATNLQCAHPQNKAQSSGDGIRIMKMDEAEFTKFSNERDLLVGRKQYFESRTRLMSPETRKRYSEFHIGTFLRIEHPGGNEDLVKGSWSLDRSRSDWKHSFRYFPLTPEVVRVHLSDEKRRFHEQQNGLENEAVDEDFLVALQQLPHLKSLELVGGRFSRRAIELISKLPITTIYFGRCSFEDPSLSTIQGMESLEEVFFQSGLKAEAFIGLSKLPRFKSFYIGSLYSKDFETPIDARIQQAIRSLDGRLESFVVNDFSSEVHSSVVRALLDVHSLRVLNFDTIGPGLTIDDVRKLSGLNHLEEIVFNLPLDFKAEHQNEAKRLIGEVQKSAAQRRLNPEKRNLEVSGDRRTDR